MVVTQSVYAARTVDLGAAELDGVPTVYDHLEGLLGRPAVDLGTWVDEHRAAFVGGSGRRPADRPAQ